MIKSRNFTYKTRAKFDKERARLEFRRSKLDKILTEREREEKLRAFEKKAKRQTRRLKYYAELLYVDNDHFAKEFLGFLTILNYDRSREVETRRFFRYDDSDRRLYLDIYRRKDADRTKKSKLFVYIHGGGWIGGAPETRESFTTNVAAAGYVVASVFYGHAPSYSHPKPIENIYKAFAFLRGHADEFGYESDGIFVGGESAGAHLACMAAAISTNPLYAAHFCLDVRSADTKIIGAVFNCGVFDLEKALTTGFRDIKLYVTAYCGGREYSELDEETKKEISPINWITPDFPPVFAISGARDKLAVLTFDFVEKLDSLGVKCEHFHGTGLMSVHAFAVAQILPISKQAMRGTRAFLYSLKNT
jgi:acetyl esterase/lipase